MAAEHAALIGARIREAREDAHLTQAALALEIPGKSDGTQVSKWERGEHRVSDDTLKHIARVLGRDVAWFHTAEPDKSETPDPFGVVATDGDDTQKQLSELRSDVADLKDQLGQLVALLTGDPAKTAILSDALVRALERALNQRAREAGKPRRPRRQPPPEEGQRPAA